MAIAFKGNTIGIFILCVVTIVSLVFWGFERIKTPDEDNIMPSLNAASFVNPNFGKKDYVSALSEAIRQIKQDANLIHQRFEMEYEPWQEFYMMMWNMPEHAWEIIRYKFAVKILKGFLQEQPPTFTMLFTGTSVTAGHESFYGRSYVGIIEERMKKTLRAAGINAIVRNMAQPAFGCQVNNYCFPSLGINPDEEIDFMSWENTFNCGAENTPVLEYFARVAAQHKAIAFYSASGGASLGNCEASRDPVPYISYDWTPDVAGITHIYSPSMAKVSDYKKRLLNRFRNGPAADKLVRLSQRPYKGTAPHGMSMFSRTRQACNATNILNPQYMPTKPKKIVEKSVGKTATVETKNATERRQLAVEKDIDPSSITMPLTPPAKTGKGAKGASGAKAASKAAPVKAAPVKAAPVAVAANKKSNITTAPPPPSRNAYCMTNDLWAQMCHDQGGPKIATREFNFKGNDPGVVQGRASYNPSAGLHILRAELFLYNYYHILLDAIFNLQKDLSLISPKLHSDPAAMFKNQLDMYERKLVALQRTLTEPLSEPKHCAAWECGNPTENTQCFTEFQPNYLSPRSSAAAANVLKTNSFAASTDHTLSSVIVGNATKDGWVKVEKNVLAARQFGNKDRQVYFYTEEFGSRLPLLISLQHGKTIPLARNAKEAKTWNNENEGIVKLYHASEKATLEYAEFYLETNVVASEDQIPDFLKRFSNRVYTAASNKTPVKLIKNLHYVYQKGNVHFYGLPQGIHVLFVQTPSESSLKTLAQTLNAQYAKEFKEQMEDIDVSKSTKKMAEMGRRLAKEENEEVETKASAKAVSKILEPVPTKAANKEEEKEEKKKGPKVIEAESLAKMSVGQLVIF